MSPLTQVTKQDILAGDEIEFSFWHLVLVAEMPAEAHVVIRLGEYFEFEKTIDIPLFRNDLPGEMDRNGNHSEWNEHLFSSS